MCQPADSVLAMGEFFGNPNSKTAQTSQVGKNLIFIEVQPPIMCSVMLVDDCDFELIR